MERVLPDIVKVLDVPIEERAEDEFARRCGPPGGALAAPGPLGQHADRAGPEDAAFPERQTGKGAIR